MSTLSDNIRYLRKKRGWSQDFLAAQLGYKSYTTIQKWESGVSEPPLKRAHAIADLFQVDIDDLTKKRFDMSDQVHSSSMPSNAIPFSGTGMCPVLGQIPAGIPSLACEFIEGYEPIDRPNPEEYYWLRVNGYSMIGAGIQSGDFVLIHHQNYAEDNQIVAARVNGDEATLKRYKDQGDTIVLLPENDDYPIRVVSKKDFETGDAAIMGVAVEFKRKL